jgi:hypothetical protein
MPSSRAMNKLRDAMEVPRLGAQPPATFQLPFLSWFFSILATHFLQALPHADIHTRVPHVSVQFRQKLGSQESVDEGTEL